MRKTILITGATDGIGLETAKQLALKGHDLVLHGRSAEKLQVTLEQINALAPQINVTSLKADFSDLAEVKLLGMSVLKQGLKIDVLINNAGVFKVADPSTKHGLDLRFVVNTLAPYLLTKTLMPAYSASARVLNLSSAAQAPVSFAALNGQKSMSDMEAYAQSKLAITMWTRELARALPGELVLIAVNPGSLLASKMVKEGFGIAGNDLSQGADILADLALSPAYTNSSGQYFDNDAGRFASPQHDGSDDQKAAKLVANMDTILGQALS